MTNKIDYKDIVKTAYSLTMRIQILDVKLNDNKARLKTIKMTDLVLIKEKKDLEEQRHTFFLKMIKYE